jgi:hypothetical protein
MTTTTITADTHEFVGSGYYVLGPTTGDYTSNALVQTWPGPLNQTHNSFTSVPQQLSGNTDGANYYVFYSGNSYYVRAFSGGAQTLAGTTTGNIFGVQYVSGGAGAAIFKIWAYGQIRNIRVTSSTTAVTLGSNNYYLNGSPYTFPLPTGTPTGTYSSDPGAPINYVSGSVFNVQNTQVCSTVSTAIPVRSILFRYAAVKAIVTSVGSSIRAATRLKTALATSASSAFNKVQHYFVSLYSTIFDSTKFIGVKFNTSTATTSTDGVNWTVQTLPSSNRWVSIATNNTTSIAIAQNSNVISKTTNGSDWVNVSLPSSRTWSCIAVIGSTFVSVALNSDQCVTSTDSGVTWTEYTLPVSTHWTGICSNGTIFCAVGNNGACATSVDGMSWTARTMPDSKQYNSVTWAANQFTAVASESNTAAISSDGVYWTTATMSKTANWRGVGPGYTVRAIG